MQKYKWFDPRLHITQISTRPGDSQEEMLLNQMVTATALMTGAAGLVWGLLYFSFGEWLPGSIPFAYGILLHLAVLLFAFNYNLRLLRGVLLTFLLLLPFLLM